MPRARTSKPLSDAGGVAQHSVLQEIAVETNPGHLRMLGFTPPALPRRAPLVVVLHGCTQTAASYDRGAGWTTLAARHDFAVLYPEQRRANNQNGCFNWFEAGDTRRGAGEVASIAAGVAAMVALHGLDPTRVFVTGLSAGGAMAAACLAAYPDIFAGGAIIAGLPYGGVSGVPAALGAMQSPPTTDARMLGDAVRRASGYSGPWPRVSIWHGVADRTVNAKNGDALIAQWLDVHGIAASPSVLMAEGRDQHRVWSNAAGVPVVELHRIDGMAHGTPLDAGSDGSAAGPFMLDVGVASSAEIAAFWGIADRAARRPHTAAAKAAPPASVKPAATKTAAKPARGGGLDIGKVIHDALHTAGLLR